MTEIAKPGKRQLVFDGDGSQYGDAGLPCSVCGKHQVHEVFIRVREKVPGGTRHLMLVCPDCVARLFLQVERLDLWRHVSGVVMAAIRRLLEKRRAKEAKKAEPANTRQALGSLPGPKAPSQGLEKLLPGKPEKP